MKYIFFLAFLTICSTAFSQKIFHVYDGFTLELIDSVDVTSKEKKTDISRLSKGIYTVSNAKKGTQLTFTKPGYQTESFECLNTKSASHTIILKPEESVLNSFKANLPYYRPLMSGSDEIENKEKAPEAPSDEQDSLSETAILMIVEEPAQFPGGQQALMKYLQRNIHYPLQASELGISGKVYLQFIVSTSGKISNVKVVKGANLPMDAEAYRVIKNMPDWTPAYVNGKTVNSYFSLPIIFKLQ